MKNLKFQSFKRIGLLLVLAIQTLIFVFPFSASADNCSYVITLSSSKSTALRTESVVLKASVTRTAVTGNISKCDQKVEVLITEKSGLAIRSKDLYFNQNQSQGSVEFTEPVDNLTPKNIRIDAVSEVNVIAKVFNSSSAVLAIKLVDSKDQFGCKKADGVYACYPTYQAAADSGCSIPVNKVEGSHCGCTQEEIGAGVIGKNCKKNGGTGKPAGDDKDSKTDTKLDETLYNPLPEDALVNVVLYITQGFLTFAGVWAVLFIIIGGLRMVLAQGNEEKYTEAKKTVTWAILGMVIAMLSFSIVAIVQNLLRANVKSPGSYDNQRTINLS